MQHEAVVGHSGMGYDQRIRTTEAEIAAMKAGGYGVETLTEIRGFMALRPRAEALCGEINEAFDGVVLGDGTGILEGFGKDDHASPGELLALRSQDERFDWRAIPGDRLQSISCFSFMDAEAARFHLPVCMLAELKGPEITHNIVWGLTLPYYSNDEFKKRLEEKYSLLNPRQRAVVRSFLLFHLEKQNLDWGGYPEKYQVGADTGIERALEVYWRE